MKFSKNITIGIALLALSTFCITTPYAHSTLIKKDANEQPISFAARLVTANINLIKNKFFDEYPDAIVFNIGKARTNAPFLKSLLSNMTSEFRDQNRDILAVYLANAIETNLKENNMQSLEKYNPTRMFQLME
jgi:hypothetical protein